MSEPRPAPSSLQEACEALERQLLVLARFTGGRTHHRHTLRLAGHQGVVSAKERLRQDQLAQARRDRDMASGYSTSDPGYFRTPVCTHPACRLDSGLYPVLAVIEDLIDPAPVDIATALTLDRSTVIRHLQKLERRGLVYRDAGWVVRRRPRFMLTVEGFNAMTHVRQSRVRRLRMALAGWAASDTALVIDCLGRLVEALHDELGLGPLPEPMLCEHGRELRTRRCLRQRVRPRAVWEKPLDRLACDEPAD